jgi:uncharacterized protein YdaU (DUF1376 family)
VAKRDKLLAEWFWTDRWIGSSGFLLPLEPRGLYREMLSAAWPRGAKLPNDHEAIRRATGVTKEEWRRCWPKVERYWRVEGEFLVNDTQRLVYVEAKAGKERASERGKKGAEAKHARAVADAQARAQVSAQGTTQARARVSTQPRAQASLEHKPPSPSLSQIGVEPATSEYSEASERKITAADASAGVGARSFA